jgi:AAA+ superfamily predicted ATPase
MKQHLTNLIKAGYGCAYCITHEEQRVFGELLTVAKSLDYDVWQWSITDGLVRPTGKKEDKTQDPLAVLGKFMDVNHTDEGPEGNLIKNKSLLVLKDYHAFLRGNPPPMLTRALKEAIGMARSTNRPIVIIGCALHLPPELEKEVMPVEFSLPSREELKVVAVEIAASAKQELNGNSDAILDAGSGLTTTEFADAAAYSVAEKKEIDPTVVARIKADTIKKNGILEIVTQKVTLDDIGGLELLKADLFSKRNCFSKAAKEYGLPTPRPLLCVGQPGTGKSLCSQATQTIFNLPLLRLEASRLFGGVVGETEGNWRRAFATAKAIAPAVVWIDEVEGLFSGAESSGKCDGGTTSRTIKAVLQDLQYNAENLFFVFTANDIDGLPDPLIDRSDVWNVELPNQVEREAIWDIHIAKRKRAPGMFLTPKLAAMSDGFSGRQIEQAWVKAMTVAFNDGGREPMFDDVVAILKEFVPTSVTMKDAIDARRKRLANCAKPASTPIETKTVSMKRKIA